MAYKIWSVIPPSAGPTRTPKEAFLIDEEHSTKEAVDQWLSDNEYEGYEADEEVTGITGGGGGIRPTSSGGRPVL